MTDWERRPASDEPNMETRSFQDERGRRWSGSVTSGRFEGGEENAEILFVCEDQPDELKRVADMGMPPAQADDAWSAMGEGERQDLFRQSRPA